MASTRTPTVSSRAAQDRSVGRLLGDRYRVVSRLGEGGMGTVYLCEHAVLGRRFAVKVLRPERALDGELAARFRSEAIAASRIGQENVVEVVDFGVEEDGTLYYVMEALEGRSLGALLAEEGPLAAPRALALLEQICRALAAAHVRGVVHRDVKPDNVFVVRREDGTERAKVIDFGVSDVTLAGAPERPERKGAIVGTPEYMAPEQAAGEPVDARTDVYGVGVLAFEILTGTLPFAAETPVAVLLAHRTRAPEAPSCRRAGIAREVDELVLHALAKRPQDRYASMEAFAEAAARIRSALVERESVRGEPAGREEGERGWWRRRAVVVAAVAVSTAVGWWWVGERGGAVGAGAATAAAPGAVAAAASGAAAAAGAAAGAVAAAAPGAVAAAAPGGVAAAAPGAVAAAAPGAVAAAAPGAVAAAASGAVAAAASGAVAAAASGAAPATLTSTRSRSRNTVRDGAARRPVATGPEPHLDDPYASSALKPDPFE